jgi:hypothetical protein
MLRPLLSENAAVDSDNGARTGGGEGTALIATEHTDKSRQKNKITRLVRQNVQFAVKPLSSLRRPLSALGHINKSLDEMALNDAWRTVGFPARSGETSAGKMLSRTNGADDTALRSTPCPRGLRDTFRAPSTAAAPKEAVKPLW